MTDEAKSPTEKFVEETRAGFAYAYDKKGELMKRLGVRGFPSAYLIDAAGTIVWEGHPMSLNAATIEKSLGGAFANPLWEGSKQTAKARKAILKREFDKAFGELGKLQDDEARELEKALEALVEKRLGAMEARLEKGDYLSAERLADALADELGKHPEVRRVAAVEEALKAKEVKALLKLQEKVEDLAAEDFTTGKQVLELIEKLEELAEEAPGTYVAEDARHRANSLRELLR